MQLELKTKRLQARLGCWILGLAATFHAPCFAQITIRVPADISTIQGAINAAQNGDTILVSPGTYAENIDFKGKGITVTSGATSYSQAAATVISPTAGGPVVTFQTNEPPTAVLNGFTIQNSHASSTSTYRAGVLILGTASPTVSNNFITKNQGTGLSIDNDNIVGFTGGYITGGASPLIQGNEISATIINPGGGATPLYIRGGGDVQLISNVVENNDFGLGMGSPNGSNEYYAIDSRYNTSLLMRGNIIRKNTGYTYYSLNTQGVQLITLIENLIYGNLSAEEVQGYQDGFQIGGGFLTETNNTLYQSFENAYPTGSRPPNPSAVIENNLFINTLGEPGISCNSNALFYTRSNDIPNLFSPFLGGFTYPRCSAGPGTLSIDPQFISPSASNFRVQSTSPVIAAGDIGAPGIPPTDLDGKNRTVCGTIDMGAYEHHPSPPIALSSSANPSVGGSSVTFSAQLTGQLQHPHWPHYIPRWCHAPRYRHPQQQRVRSVQYCVAHGWHPYHHDHLPWRFQLRSEHLGSPHAGRNRLSDRDFTPGFSQSCHGLSDHHPYLQRHVSVWNAKRNHHLLLRQYNACHGPAQRKRRRHRYCQFSWSRHLQSHCDLQREHSLRR